MEKISKMGLILIITALTVTASAVIGDRYTRIKNEREMMRIENNMAPNAVRYHRSQDPINYRKIEGSFYEIFKEGEKIYIPFTNERGDTLNTRVQ